MTEIQQSEHIKRPLSELKLWDENPRRGTKQGMDKLRRKIEKRGLYKALVTTPDGVIIGGNMRYRVLLEMGVTEAWCSVYEPKDEADMIEVAISDNESEGEWVEEELAELIHDQPIELDLYSVHLNQPVSLAKLMEQESDEKPAGGSELTCPECGHSDVISAFRQV